MINFFKKICGEKNKKEVSQKLNYDKEINSVFECLFNKNIKDKLTSEEVMSLYSEEMIDKHPNLVDAIVIRDNEKLIQEDYETLNGVRNKVNFIKFIIVESYIISNLKYKIDIFESDTPFIKNLLITDVSIIDKFNLKKDYAYSYIFNYVSDELKNNKEFIIPFIKLDGRVLKFLSDVFKDDISIASLAINSEYLPGAALKYVSDRLKNDKKFVFDSLYENGANFKYAADELKNDIDFLYELAKNKKIRAFDCVSDEKKKELAMLIKKENNYELGAFCLSVLPEYFCDDKQMVMNAVKDNGQLLMHASDRLKDDKDVVMTAVKWKWRGSCTPLRYASKRLRADREIADVAIKYEPLSYQDMDSSIRDEYSNR